MGHIVKIYGGGKAPQQRASQQQLWRARIYMESPPDVFLSIDTDCNRIPQQSPSILCVALD
jgi:hypothetical protein